MQSYEDVFGKDFDKVGGDEPFATLPDKTYVLATIEGVKPKTFGDGRASVEVVSKASRIQAGVEGNFGHPKFWDMLSFAVPEIPDPTLPEDELKKARQRAGFWAKRVKAVGVDYKAITPGMAAGDLAALFAPAVGSTVIIRTGIKPASGDYPAKAIARDYYPDTIENRAKYGLADEEVDL